MNGIKKVFNRNSTDAEDPHYVEQSAKSDNTALTNGINPRTSHASSTDRSSQSGVASQAPVTNRATRNASVDNSITSPTSTSSPTSKISGQGPGRSQEVSTQSGTMPHSHDTSAGQKVDLSKGHVTQSVEHVGEITNKTHHKHTIEEVERQRDIERHQHHVQIHHQPINHEERTAEQVHQKIHPVTQIAEKHASTDKDAKLLHTVAGSHNFQAGESHAAEQRQVVDRGEVVREDLHTHIHNVVVPLVNHDVHEHHRIKTVIPTQHVIHEAPIIHESSTLKAISKADFLKGGGVLGSSTKDVDSGNFLSQGQCERKVDGVAEQLERDLNLKPSAHGASAVN